MAAWQVHLHVVPRRALAPPLHPIDAHALEHTAWWAIESFPADYRKRLDVLAAPHHAAPGAIESWGAEHSNRVDVWSGGGRVTRMIVRVDVRRLDAGFCAGIIKFVRAASAVLIRTDGLVVEPTIDAFAGALRSSAAWRHTNDPATFLANQEARDDEIE